jgi:hypothetical protein
MTSSWVWPAIAALLLWLPLVSTLLLRKSGDSRRLSETPSAKALIAYWPNWVDLVRCAIAMALMVAWGNSLRQEDPASGKLVIGIIVAITIAGLFIQAILVPNRRTLFVPLPIILASAIFVPGWDLGLFAVLVAWGLCAASEKFNLLIPILAGILMLGGLVLGTNLFDLVAAVLIVGMPQFFALMFGRHLILPSKALPSQ